MTKRGDMTKREELVSRLVERRYGGGRSSPPGPNGRRRIPVQRLLLAIVAMLMLTSTVAGQVYVDSNFRGTTATDWTFLAGKGATPLLTAAQGIDTDGKGWLRLNNDATNQSTFSYHNNAIPTAKGLKFEFEFVIWRQSDHLPADGLALVVFDAAKTPSAGGYGGSLGYAQRSDQVGDPPVTVLTPGLDGGVIGIGFDEFGNFSRNSEGRSGGPAPGATPNAIAIRGSMGATRNDGYAYVTGTGSLDDFSFQNVAYNEARNTTALPTNKSMIHRVAITITPQKKITVSLGLQQDDGSFEFDDPIKNADCNINCPDLVMFGFTAGTGASTAFHEIRNLQVSAAPEPGTLALMFLGGVVGAGMYWRRRMRTAKAEPA